MSGDKDMLDFSMISDNYISRIRENRENQYKVQTLKVCNIHNLCQFYCLVLLHLLQNNGNCCTRLQFAL